MNTRNLSAWLKPVYDELQTYIITLICILLLITHFEFRAFSVKLRIADLLGMVPIVLLAIFGGLLSLFNVLIDRPKESWEKTGMIGLVMGANGTAGLAAGMELLPEGFTIAAVIPLWNIVTSVLLLYYMGFASEDVLSDEDATLKQVAVATGMLLGVFAFCEWILHLTWPMTFSVSTAFASVSAHFFRRPDRP